MMKTNSLLKRLFSVLAGLVLGASALLAQNTITVRGTILDGEKQPVIGAGVMQAGTTNGASTDLDGHFTITVPMGADLVISAIGYETLTVKASSSTLNITLNEEATQLDETVVVGYGSQKKASLTSAITNIQSEDITSTKQSNLTAALQGKVPGLMIRQQSGAVGWFDDAISLRGYGSPLVIIDGVARGSRQITSHGWGRSDNSSTAALAELNPEDIESITVLKDASASIYGLGAQNGVILVTTKKGQVGTPQISYSTTLTYGVPTALPKEVDIATWMEMDNEMRRNKRGESLRYDAEMINKYRNHLDGAKEFSWYDAIMKDHTFSQVHNFSIRGGTQQTQYYLSANYTNQDAIYRANTGDYNRYGLTGSFTTNLTQNLQLTYQTALQVMHQEMPPANTTQNAMYYGLLTERFYPAEVSPGHYTYNVVEHRNAVALMVSDVAGSQTDNDVVLRNNLDLKYTAPWLKGLQITASAAYDFTQRNRHTLSRHFPLYDINTDQIAGYNPDNDQISESWNQRLSYYGRLQAQYNGTIAQNHHIGVTLAAEARLNKNSDLSGSRRYSFFTHDLLGQGDSSTASNGGSRGENATAGYVGRVNYDYKGKYLFEVMARYDGTYFYAPGYRWNLFPSYSVGWRVSDEPFFKAILPKVNNLKFRWSDGFTGQSQGSAYAYITGYSNNGSMIFEDGSSVSGYASRSMASYLSWAKYRMMDFGIDMEAWRGLLGLTVDWFWRRTSGIAANSTSKIPDFLGVSLPQQNLNKSENVGVELSLSHRNTLKNGFSYRVVLNATYARSRNTYQAAEATRTYANSPAYFSNYFINRWGNARGSWTYHWLPGNEQFTGWDDINSYPIRYGNMQNMLPGMYKIEDRNGDGVINQNGDQYFTWQETNPPLQFGLVMSGSYKNFDINMNFTAATLVNKSVSLAGGMGYGFFSTFYENYLDRWHLSDPNADPFDPNSQWIPGYWPALYPATSAYDGRVLTYGTNQPYTFVDGTYLRLKSLEVGYRFQGSFLQKLHLRSLRVFANGSNLLTFCNKLLKPYDPERNQSSYLGVAGTPLMKNFALGINLQF
jgi:TonB-linked SusC/RagA family outer membrane protein